MTCLTKNDIPVVIAPPSDPTGDSASRVGDLPSSSPIVAQDTIPMHLQNQAYEEIQSITATFSLEDFTNASFSSLSDLQGTTALVIYHFPTYSFLHRMELFLNV